MTSARRETAAPRTGRGGSEKPDARKHRTVSEYHNDGDLASPLDRPLRITKFSDQWAKGKSDLTVSLNELAEKLPDRFAKAKGKLPWLKLARFGKRRSKKGCLRRNVNMLTISGIEADYDGEQVSVAEAAKLLRKEGLAALIYTSASHMPDQPRYRILCPCSQDLPPSERTRLMARLNGALGGIVAVESFTPSQAYYYGSVDGQAPAYVELIDGCFIDLADDLDAGALGRKGRPYEEPVELDDDDADLLPELDPDEIESALAAIPAEVWDDSYNDWLKIGMAIHHATRGSDDGLELWNKASQRCLSYDNDELEKKWESFGGYDGRPVTIRTVFGAAIKHGWKRKASPSGDLALIDPAAWEGIDPPAREWIWAGRIPLGQATYFTGPGSAGKSLLSQQLATCIAVGRPLLGIGTQEATSIYLTCEDDAAELHRRQAAICESMDVSLQSLSGRLYLASLVGAIGNEMATFDTEGRMKVTAAYERLETIANDTGATFIVLDNVAHLFAGNENIRNQAAAFVGLMNRLATTIGGSVLFLGHPNKAGQEYSGSTAWENQVRSRLFLNWGEIDQETRVPLDPDARVLTTGKANYGRKGNAVEFRWHNGAFVTDEELGDDEAREIADSTDEKTFLRCLDFRVEQRRPVSDSKASRTYAPKTFAVMPQGKPIGPRRLEAAMERLFHYGVIVRGVIGRANGKDLIGLRRAQNDDDE